MNNIIIPQWTKMSRVTSPTSKRKVSLQATGPGTKQRSVLARSNQGEAGNLQPPLVQSTTSSSARGSSPCWLARDKSIERKLSSRTTYSTQLRCPTPSPARCPTFHPPPTGPPASTLKNHSNGYSLRPRSYLCSSSTSLSPVRKGGIRDYI